VQRPHHFSVRLDSRSLARLDYDLRTRVLVMAFRNGHRYAYDDVAPAEVKALVTADSLGAHFNRHIRDAHPAHRLD
jgi:hypothetical protein